jgi:hypothetical protein
MVRNGTSAASFLGSAAIAAGGKLEGRDARSVGDVALPQPARQNPARSAASIVFIVLPVA